MHFTPPSMSTQFKPILHFAPSIGLLDAVNNLKSESRGQVIQLTWDAPFTLDITGVDPDIQYRVDITVANIPLNTYSISIVINLTEFNFTMDDYNGTNTSAVYAFQITPINGAGDGTTRFPVTGYFSGRKFLVWRAVAEK